MSSNENNVNTPDNDDDPLLYVRNLFDEQEELTPEAEAAPEAQAEEPEAEAKNSAAPKPANTDAPKPEKASGKGKQNKDPMQDLVDELDQFVKEINEDVTGLFKKAGQKIWDKIEPTEPMQKLKAGLNEAKEFMENKTGLDFDSAKGFVGSIMKKIGDSFAQLKDDIEAKMQAKSAPNNDKSDENLDENDQLADSDLDTEQTLLAGEDAEPEADTDLLADAGMDAQEDDATVKMEAGEDSAESDLVKAFGEKVFDDLLENDKNVTSTSKPEQPSKGQDLENEQTSGMGMST
ncbi:MAG: hypothetical protein BGO90_05545 [Legionella sp. 40-6]|nr:hypothetical protein [Legionella sp.]OJY39268.1 MAG: hypothetical protein BGO90_05545 [Legionella sp. 40-6]